MNLDAYWQGTTDGATSLAADLLYDITGERV